MRFFLGATECAQGMVLDGLGEHEGHEEQEEEEEEKACSRAGTTEHEVNGPDQAPPLRLNRLKRQIHL